MVQKNIYVNNTEIRKKISQIVLSFQGNIIYLQWKILLIVISTTLINFKIMEAIYGKSRHSHQPTCFGTV